MYFHVRITQKSNKRHDETKLDLSEEQLIERVIKPYENGEPIIINGKTISGNDIERIRITQSNEKSEILIQQVRYEQTTSSVMVVGGPSIEWLAADKAKNVTDEYITHPPGFPSKTEAVSSQSNITHTPSPYSWENIRNSPIALILSTVILTSCITFAVLNLFIIKPLEQKIDDLKGLNYSQETKISNDDIEPEALRLLEYLYTLQTKYALNKMIISRDGILRNGSNNIEEDIDIIKDFFNLEKVDEINIFAFEKLLLKIPMKYLQRIPETRLGSPYVLSVTFEGIKYINTRKI